MAVPGGRGASFSLAGVRGAGSGAGPRFGKGRGVGTMRQTVYTAAWIMAVVVTSRLVSGGTFW
ncbi:hypothetical protein AB0N06_37760, partial [Streptomyces sp. NPDC051020]|uniref:hypothetical protein n=1 Tax=Streptomyces sp. NPDC051020 TaxID=3155409 RepID=UPI003417304D